MHPIAFEQDLNITPSRAGQQIALGVTSTSEAYDITQLPLDGCIAQQGGAGADDPIFVRLQADGNNIYYTFTSATQAAATAINDANVTVAGSVTALTGTQQNAANCEFIPANSSIDFRIWRSIDKTKALPTTTSSKCRRSSSSLRSRMPFASSAPRSMPSLLTRT